MLHGCYLLFAFWRRYSFWGPVMGLQHTNECECSVPNTLHVWITGAHSAVFSIQT